MKSVLYVCIIHIILDFTSGFIVPNDHLLSPEVAKSVLIRPLNREKRGLFNGEEVADRQRETVKDANQLTANSIFAACKNKCWKEWSSFGPCSGPCNSGVRTRTRALNDARPQECKNVKCAGDSVQTQECVIKCGHHGNPGPNGCICLPGYVGLCCQDRITCPKPPNPQNGHVGGNEIWPAYYDAVAIYTCKQGYTLSGPVQRRCQLSSTWSGQQPTCTKLICSAPGTIEDGKIINRKSTYYYQDTIGYQCDIGYKLSGASSRQCIINAAGDAVWNVHAPRCQAERCGDPGTPKYGRRSGTEFSFNGRVTFTCQEGYTMIGSQDRLCLSTGQWSGTQPVCKETLCPMIENPAHGFISSPFSLVNTVVVFSCERGYRLEGDEYLACLANGRWNGTAPQCVAIGCEHPGMPSHGAVQNNGLLLGNKVHFYCHGGYTLHGAKESQCLRDGSWSHAVPRCTACPMNHYKQGPADGGQCLPCPAHSHTVTIAATNQRHCLCDNGFLGNPGGPCQAIQCLDLDIPLNGKLVGCNGQGFGARCTFDCNDGYILVQGSSVRTCLQNQQWDGIDSVCQACPSDTYKAAPSVCLPCPAHSGSPPASNHIDSCTCKVGFEQSDKGQCVDINECERGSDLCTQSCTNTRGSYNCACHIHGYKLQDDMKTCIAEHSCRNLTQGDAPINGGLVCHWFNEQNSQTCVTKCNPGYDMVLRTNAYETCGPITGYEWTFEKIYPYIDDTTGEVIVPTAIELTIPPCIEEFFPDMRLEADSFYFVKACKDLTDMDKFLVKREFSKSLTDKGLCMMRDSKVCDLRSAGVICGTEWRRRKRGTDYENISVDVVNIKFNIVANKSEALSVNCDSKICPMLRIPASHCQRFCLQAYNRYLRGAVLHAKRQLNTMFHGDKSQLSFQVSDKIFEPLENDDEAIQVSDVIVDCDKGMKSNNGMCVPCNPGSYYSAADNECYPCDPGFYQSLPAQSTCKQCPVGSTSLKPSATECNTCKAGRYGDRCTQMCKPCNHGKCHAVTGDCLCDSGWQGDTCNQDIPGCERNSCHGSTRCEDVAAPGTGFICV